MAQHEDIASSDVPTLHPTLNGKGPPSDHLTYFLTINYQASTTKAFPEDENSMRDKNGFPYAQKAMIRCGLSKDWNGLWRVSQLFPHLQNIVKKHQEYFEGEKGFLPQNIPDLLRKGLSPSKYSWCGNEL